MRTFVLMRQHALNYKERQQKLLKLEKKYDRNLKEIYAAPSLLINDKVQRDGQRFRRRIGFKTNKDESV